MARGYGGRVAQAAGSPPGRAPRAAPTRQEVEDGHVDDVEEAAAAAVRVDLLHRVAVKRVDFPPGGRTGPGLQKPGRQGVRPASMPPGPARAAGGRRPHLGKDLGKDPRDGQTPWVRRGGALSPRVSEHRLAGRRTARVPRGHPLPLRPLAQPLGRLPSGLPSRSQPPCQPSSAISLPHGLLRLERPQVPFRLRGGGLPQPSRVPKDLSRPPEILTRLLLFPPRLGWLDRRAHSFSHLVLTEDLPCARECATPWGTTVRSRLHGVDSANPAPPAASPWASLRDSRWALRSHSLATVCRPAGPQSFLKGQPRSVLSPPASSAGYAVGSL